MVPSITPEHVRWAPCGRHPTRVTDGEAAVERRRPACSRHEGRDRSELGTVATAPTEPPAEGEAGVTSARHHRRMVAGTRTRPGSPPPGEGRA
jgi:hypothetical protein